MRSCISGSIGVGKTTLIEQLKTDFNVIPEVCRGISSYGFGINNYDNNIISTQLAMLNVMYSNIINNKDGIFDRGLLDILVFSYYLYKNNKINNKQYQFIYDNIIYNLNLFDVIFYIPIEFDLKDDGFRSIDVVLRFNIDIIFKMFFEKLNLKDKIVIINGDINQRLNTIKTTIERKENERKNHS